MSDEAHRELPVSRRDVICGGGASVFSAMIAALLGGTGAARAEAPSGAVAEVDALAVGGVTDSYQFAVAPSRTAERVEIQHFGRGIGGDKTPRRSRVDAF